ncbi:MAG TPA: S8 family peptidase, partial [Pyrinomonadaceae bacterium]|nr:S8 family peptidase [Pyrinomonadaceae bacterium]
MRRTRPNKENDGDDRVKVILQIDGRVTSRLNGFLNQRSVKVGRFNNLNLSAVELPASLVEELAASEEVSYVSLDKEVRTFGHVSLTTGADAVRAQTRPDGTSYTLDGSGIGIAVIDSGIDPNHQAFLNDGGTSRIVYNQDFTGEARTDDPYGHGTHVASIAAGNGVVSNAAYVGMAPNANLINLRVLNSQGTGTVSSLLSALDWVLTNHSTYNIRVVNMSLGTSAIDSYRNDPLCRAVRSVVDQGIVVTVSAGNNGRDGSGRKIYGQVHAPGNEPSAITVGASNTYATDARGDDTVTTYSSRGPTRSFVTDELGIKHYDNLVKPDIVAPGNKIVDAEAMDNLIVTQHPELDAAVSTDPTLKQMLLNGTSMATPIAAGAAALLLQANSSLTPNLVKMILMYTAQPLDGYNLFEQGTGQINIEGAARLAKLVRTDLTGDTPLGSPLLIADPPTPETTITPSAAVNLTDTTAADFSAG